jgi:hypothetical protein
MGRNYRLAIPMGSRHNAAAGWSWRELRTMPPEHDVTTYLMIGQLDRPFREIGLAEGDRETIVRNLISGLYQNALRVVALNTAEGWSRDVSEDIAFEVLDRAFEADETLTDDTKRFIDRHIDLGEKRPPAPSVRLGGLNRKRSA